MNHLFHPHTDTVPHFLFSTLILLSFNLSSSLLCLLPPSRLIIHPLPPAAASSHPSQPPWVKALCRVSQISGSPLCVLLLRPLTWSAWWLFAVETRVSLGPTAAAGCFSPPAPSSMDGCSAWWPESPFVKPSWPVCLRWSDRKRSGWC